jgi:hypothetical protein
MGNHSMPRKHSLVARTVVVGGAAVCLGLFTAATAEADTVSQQGAGNNIQSNTGSNVNGGSQFSLTGKNRQSNRATGNVNAGNTNVNANGFQGQFTDSSTTGNTTSQQGAGNNIQSNTGGNVNSGLFSGTQFGGNNKQRNRSTGNVNAGNSNYNFNFIQVQDTDAPSTSNG